jgi:hypothetical protein
MRRARNSPWSPHSMACALHQRLHPDATGGRSTTPDRSGCVECLGVRVLPDAGLGRDFSNVMPMRGIVLGGGMQVLDVQVTVTLLAFSGRLRLYLPEANRGTRRRMRMTMTISNAADRRALQRELAFLFSVLDYAMHELPAGVLWNPDAATPAQCAELMADLNRFEVVANQLDVPTSEFIETCRWHLSHYPHYRSRQRHFVDYATYCLDRGGPLRVPSLRDRILYRA